jgi:predicted amidohydrolase
VGLAQFKPTKADVDSNLSRIREVVSEQVGMVDLLVFPETSLTGYFLEGGVAEAARSATEVSKGLGQPPEEAPMLCSASSSGTAGGSTTASYT